MFRFLSLFLKNLLLHNYDQSTQLFLISIGIFNLLGQKKVEKVIINLVTSCTIPPPLIWNCVIVFTYFASYTGYEDDILEIISNLHVQESKFGGQI